MNAVRLDLKVVRRVEKQLAQFLLRPVVDMVTRRAVTLTGSGAVDLRPGHKLLGRLGYCTQVGALCVSKSREILLDHATWHRLDRLNKDTRNDGRSYDHQNASVASHL
jgi:hypothetical protein